MLARILLPERYCESARLSKRNVQSPQRPELLCCLHFMSCWFLLSARNWRSGRPKRLSRWLLLQSDVFCRSDRLPCRYIQQPPGPVVLPGMHNVPGWQLLSRRELPPRIALSTRPVLPGWQRRRDRLPCRHLRWHRGLWSDIACRMSDVPPWLILSGKVADADAVSSRDLPCHHRWHQYGQLPRMSCIVCVPNDGPDIWNNDAVCAGLLLSAGYGEPHRQCLPCWNIHRPL